MVTIKLCDGHSGGFEMLKTFHHALTYKGVPIAQVQVISVDRDTCAECLNREKGKTK